VDTDALQLMVDLGRPSHLEQQRRMYSGELCFFHATTLQLFLMFVVLYCRTFNVMLAFNLCFCQVRSFFCFFSLAANHLIYVLLQYSPLSGILYLII